MQKSKDNERTVFMLVVLIVIGSLGALLALMLGCVIVAWMMPCWRTKTSSAKFHVRNVANVEGDADNDACLVYTFFINMQWNPLWKWK